MKKSSATLPSKDSRSKTLVEADEEFNSSNRGDLLVNRDPVNLSTAETQTDNFWPMPYEHLFLGIFPSLENCEMKPSPAPSPAPNAAQWDKFPTVIGSPYEILDRYVANLAYNHCKYLRKELCPYVSCIFLHIVILWNFQQFQNNHLNRII